MASPIASMSVMISLFCDHSLSFSLLPGPCDVSGALPSVVRRGAAEWVFIHSVPGNAISMH